MEISILGWAVYLLVGALAGIMAGLLGVGGGMIMVPALLWLLPMAGVADGHLMQTALGTSLAAIIITSIASLRAHQRRNAIRWPVVRWLAPGVVAGALLAGAIAAWLSSDLLILIFALFALIIALRIVFARPVHVVSAPANFCWPAWGLGIGTASGLVGIGGGSLTVPLLLHYGFPITQAIGSSSAVGLPIAIGGTIAYIAAGPDQHLNTGLAGFVYLPAVLCLSLASWFTAPFGAKLAHRWPAARLKKIFALFLLIVSARLFWRVLVA
ncbi:sulfite exporter TauE/SafE family protein [Permianibacter aggregans]|uniref:Probable membrane transporter protein n=1 Tax=Permianibacter aggregans TaxID=1510150 RepID=A0A4R6UT03_9GAMM|nr:sulfite exporter TauE/SafE family protein [Permianibacter aggregans]TDQ49396.1 putative membrane protein YfcA [Permianibacter aggregans]